MRKKSLFAILISALLIISCVPMSAFAEELDENPFIVTGGTEGVDYIWDGSIGNHKLNNTNNLLIKTAKPLVISNKTPDPILKTRIVISRGITANITIKDLYIDLDEKMCPAIEASGANLNLNVEGTNTLIGGPTCAAIEKDTMSYYDPHEDMPYPHEPGYPPVDKPNPEKKKDNFKLVIKSNSGNGILNAKGGDQLSNMMAAAGIGSGSISGTNNIFIENVTIFSKGGNDDGGAGAGIGGGGCVNPNEPAPAGYADTISIKNSTITALAGNDSAAGIGGGGKKGILINFTLEDSFVIAKGTTITQEPNGKANAIGHGSHVDSKQVAPAIVEPKNSIVLDGATKTGRVYGTYKLTKDQKLPDGFTLTIPKGCAIDSTKAKLILGKNAKIIRETGSKNIYLNNENKIVSETYGPGEKIIERITYNENGSYVKDGFKPEIIEGNNQVCNETKSTKFRSSDELINFLKVTINGKDLNPKNYTVESGSIKVTLKDTYLKTLPNGKYTLGIVSTNGTAKTDFTIAIPDETSKPSKEESVKTADTSNILLWGTVFSANAIALAYIYLKRK